MRLLPTRIAAILPMDSFAVVMATGIVSIAAHDSGYPLISYALEIVASVVFVALLALVGLRLLRQKQVLKGDLREPTQVFGFYTFVAACDVLNARFHVGPGSLWMLVGLGVAALAVWLLLVPVTFRAMRSLAPSALGARARGSWLLSAVGTQSLAVITAEFALRGSSRVLLGVALAWWVLGVVIYLGISGLIVWRLVSERVDPDAITPDSWVLMGALAITALAGGKLLQGAAQPFAFEGLQGIVFIATVTVWAFGTAWIPLLLAGEAWRLSRGNGAMRYDRARWATVFPLGMYAAASYTLARGWLGGPAPLLEIVAHVFFWTALVLWCITAFGLVRVGMTRLRHG